MSISKRIMNISKIKLLNDKNIQEYTSIYWETYDNTFRIIKNDSELII